MPGDLRRRHDGDPRHLRRRAGGAGPRLRPGALHLQQDRRRVPRLRGPGIENGGDELPAGRQGALRGVRRHALQPLDARGALEGALHRRGAPHGDRRGGGVLRCSSGDRASAQATRGRGPRVPHARAALAHALRRRGAAHQARHGACEGPPGRHVRGAREAHALRS